MRTLDMLPKSVRCTLDFTAMITEVLQIWEVKLEVHGHVSPLGLCLPTDFTEIHAVPELRHPVHAVVDPQLLLF